ncbi:MAG: CehA/McbA family metallohydrolase [Planctomycetota bacterium]
MHLKVQLQVALPLLAAGSLAAQLPIQNACGVSYSSSGAACPPGFVNPPQGWHSGDTHEHIQLCFDSMDATSTEIYAEMIANDLGVSNALIWGAGFITPDQFNAYVSQFVTGMEDPATIGDPTKIIQFGIETSGVSCGNLGHMIGLNITSAEADIFQLQSGCAPLYPAAGWKNDGSGDYSEPILNLFRQAPDAVNGYAHQSWPVQLHADKFAGGWDWEDPLLPLYVGEDVKCSFGMDMAFPVPKTCGNTHPVLAPFDVAFGKIDFLEAFEMLNSTCGGPLEKRYFGMYYKLLNAGQSVALTAGSDADCIGLACEPRTWAKLETGETSSYTNWTDAVQKGRTSIGVGPYQFLGLEVDGLDIGSTLHVTSPGTGTASVSVKATYRVDLQDATTITDTIEIVQDGVVVASQAFGPISGGMHTYIVDVPVTKSGWIAARTASFSTHTSAIFMRLDGQPTANCQDAEYWTLYADFLNSTLDLAAFVSAEALEFYVGCSDLEIRDYIARGRRVFAAIRDYDNPLPTGISRFGTASPSSCAPPPAMVASEPAVMGQNFTLRYFNAPPNASGGLLFSTTPLPDGLPILGANFHILLNPALDPVVSISDDAGYGETTVPLPPVSGVTVYAQYAWFNPTGCDTDGVLSASDALTIDIQ